MVFRKSQKTSSKKKKQRTSERGFTLIELMLALSILSILTLAVVQSIRRALQNKSRIETLSDHHATLRDAMDVIVVDIKNAFHFRDFALEMEIEARKALAKAKVPAGAAAGRAASGASAGGDPDGDGSGDGDSASGDAAGSGTDVASLSPEDQDAIAKLETQRRAAETHFVGEKTKLNFVSLNLPRIRKNQKTANYLEVGYELENCEVNSGKKKRTTKCLVRRAHSQVDRDILEGGRKINLLSDVTKLEFRYFGLGKADWTSQWKTDQNGDGVTRGNFPNLVEVTLEVEFPVKKSDKTRSYTRKRIVPILFMNNPPEENDGVE